MSLVAVAHMRAILFSLVTVHVIRSVGSQNIFTTTPKDREVFLGTDVQLDWDFAVPSDERQVEKVRFGVLLKDATNRNEPKEITIVYKELKDDKKVWNPDSSIQWIKNRTFFVKDRRASLTIKQVQLKDSETFFCNLDFGRGERSISDTVELKVVDLLIDKKTSTEKAVSWKGHKLRVVCGVKVAPEGNDARFSWMHLPSNTTVERKYHDDSGTTSWLIMVTYDDLDFERLQCRAATKKTVKYHHINITRLYRPGAPLKLKAERIFQEGKVFIRLHWQGPSDNGGADIEKYRIEYKPTGLPWKDATSVETPSAEFTNLKLRNGVTYNVIVKAINKAGLGAASNEVDVKIDVDPEGLMSPNSAWRYNPAVTVLLCGVDLVLVSLVAWCL